MNRIEEDKCVSCGGILIAPFNEYRACSQCLPIILNVISQTKLRRRTKKKVGKVVTNGILHVTDMPLGIKV